MTTTVVDSNILPNASLDNLWADDDGDGMSDHADALKEQMQSAMRSSMTSTRIPTTMSATPVLPHLRCHPCRLGRLREQRRRQDARRICVRRCHRSHLCAEEVYRERTRRANSRSLPPVSSRSMQLQTRAQRTASASRSPRTAWTGMSPRTEPPRSISSPPTRRSFSPGQGRPRVAERQLDRFRHRERHRVHPRYGHMASYDEGTGTLDLKLAPAGVRTVKVS